MAVTKAILTEQIYRIIDGGFPSTRSRVGKAEIELAISDVANSLLKTEIFNINYNLDGGNTVDGAALAIYENIPVTRDVNWNTTKTAQVTLPATPMMLPDQIGVYSIYPSGQPHLALRYISSGSFGFWMNNRLVAPLHRRLYTVAGNKVIIYDDWFGAGYNEVDMQLVISDISTAGENDPLPIPPEFREKIVAMVIQRFVSESDTNRRETDQPSPSKRN